MVFCAKRRREATPKLTSPWGTATCAPTETWPAFAEAAKQGHGKALGYVLDDLFLRAGSLSVADPQRAMLTYHNAKSDFSSIHAVPMGAAPKSLRFGKLSSRALNVPSCSNAVYRSSSLVPGAVQLDRKCRIAGARRPVCPRAPSVRTRHAGVEATNSLRAGLTSFCVVCLDATLRR